MNVVMCYCDMCDKAFIIESKSKQYNFKSHKHNEKFCVVAKKYEIIRPDKIKIDSIINNCTRECYNKYFYTFKLRCIYDIEMTNGESVNGIISEKTLKKVFEKMVLYKN